MARKKTITLQKIADELDLTVHTVSKSLRGLPGMSEETRYEVLKLAQKWGYRTKEQERAYTVEKIPLYPLKSRRFILAIAKEQGYNSNVHPLLLEGLQERFSEFNYQIQTLIIPTDASANFPQWLEQHDVAYADGLFISPMMPANLEQVLLSLPMPKILLNFPPAGVRSDSMIWDVYDAIYQSIAHLYSYGHRKILYVGDIESHRGFRLRWQAFNEAMRNYSLDVNPQQHVIQKHTQQAAWTDDFSSKLLEQQPTAIVCSIEQYVPWIYYACGKLGKSIPQDYSLVTLENSQNSFLPEVTHPILAMKETGYRAADRMLWRLANPDRPFEHTRLQCQFYTGQTVVRIT
ncbi:LacI family transcriptional regulator [Paenibacillus psychroresistens]|uniref:LacI family transcriptional regulator n=1 Tax=Paenibacillus psychroresistens TaxID=1778678 RepID=A0A6B8REJ1_9BACL|nr:LacI family DNA-binding transcriptional regulator [Paenibacillus psychroresistens]QGQ94347.1 LacI family transcriptional regulator [Paenibacillus psychroresistens]